MATSNKAQDPAAAALSAIEEALNLSATRRLPKKNKGAGNFDADFSQGLGPRQDTESQEALSRRAVALGAPLPASPSDRIVHATPAGGGRSSAVRAEEPHRQQRRDGAGRFQRQPSQSQPSATPANDDRHSVGAILKALNQRPSPAPLIDRRAVVSIVWLAFAGFYFRAHRADYLVRMLSVSRPETLIFAILALRAGHILHGHRRSWRAARRKCV